MPNLPFTLRQLEVFTSLSATRSFRRTAELMGISQASVSNQIKTLEEQLGVSLFDRKPGRRPTLRSEGLAFLDDVREFNRSAEALASHRVADPSEGGRVQRYRVLVGQGMFDAYVRRKLDSFFAQNPNVELEFEAQLPFGQLIRAVESGSFDFALINQRADFPVHEEFRELAMVRGGVYGHRKYAAGRTLPLTPDELNMLPFILPKATSRQEREVMRNYELHGIRPRNVIGHTQYYDVMAAMLERGLGVASFSEAILPPSMREEVIQLVSLEDWRLLFFRKDHGIDARYDIVADFLVNSVLDDPNYPAISRPPAPARSHAPAGK
ncbi:LysR family transcriptional regulator [Alteraurantiacibacter aquimixticola]|uniref:LysR family transcriptional regulator n=1 Tax=Alteraurantiacibacter aquimixticola TaxID=2489173 RepID=A0A4V4U956_9SPHN|nr:LysR family transcriptional regulator [Alteraurantiacibacter aquimixticola]TIX50503.1 LysR family transcriptional regulator [Alteraurantiacibacter aquimixticola]